MSAGNGPAVLLIQQKFLPLSEEENLSVRRKNCLSEEEKLSARIANAVPALPSPMSLFIDCWIVGDKERKMVPDLRWQLWL